MDYLQLKNYIDDTHRPFLPIHKCSICEFTAESTDGLQLHIKTDHNPKAKCNLCEFEANNKDEIMEHVELSHCSKTPFYVLRALRELTTAVKTLSEDIHQVKCDSIIINNDMMSLVRGTIVEEITEHISNKFEIIDRRVDKIHQRIGEKDFEVVTTNKEVPVLGNGNAKATSKEKDQVKDTSKDKDVPKETYAKKAKVTKNKDKNNKTDQQWTITKKAKSREVLIVGTSITNNLDKRVLENATELHTDIATAYTVDSAIDAKYTDKNFLRVVPEKLNNKKYDTLVLQGGSIEITNLDTKVDKGEETVQQWKDKVEASSVKMFTLAEESIIANPGLEVVIVERIPRFDSLTNDPAQIKSQLSQYGNSIYHKLWVERGCNINIKVHDLGINFYGPLREKRFGTPGTKGFDGKFVDGIHMRGILAVKHYTDRFICSTMVDTEHSRTEDLIGTTVISLEMANKDISKMKILLGMGRMFTLSL